MFLDFSRKYKQNVDHIEQMSTTFVNDRDWLQDMKCR